MKVQLLAGISMLFLIAGMLGCAQSEESSKPQATQDSVSASSMKALCLEGAYRNGKHCGDVGSSDAMKRICNSMTFGYGDCTALPSSDFENTCKAAVFGIDSCTGIGDRNMKQACLAAAYGRDSYCESIH